MATWEKDIRENPLWLDTSNSDMYVLKKYDSTKSAWVPTSPTTAADLDAYDKEAIDAMLAELAENIDAGKYVSILGDSISTFAGWIPSGNAAFYNGTNYGVSSVDQTWWKRLLDQTGMHLCVNNSWSGSRVSGSDSSAGCMARATALHTPTQNPDIIIVFMGINDFNNEVAIGTYDGSTPFPTNTSTFREAYAIMLSKILTQYKNAEVYVCTLPYCERNGSTDFPEVNENSVQLAEWNNAIRDLADLFSVTALEFSKSGLTFYNRDVYLSDDLHPNSSGHRVLANKAIKTIDPTSTYSVLP